MRAIRLHKVGGPEQLALEEVPDPQVGPEDVLVRVRASAVCGRDLIDRRGGFPMMKLPTTLGHEFAGEVVRLGERAAEGSDLREGDRVANLLRSFCGACRECLAGRLLLCERDWQSFGHSIDGAYAELVAAPFRALVKMPPALSFELGATLMCTAGVALRALREVGRLSLGETLLVTGASGGVGSYAVQIGKRLGARVIATTTSEAKIGWLRALGADEVLVGTAFHDEARQRSDGGVDVALDLTGRPTFGSALRSLRRGGRLVLVGNIETAKVEMNPGALIVHGLSVLGSAGCMHRDLHEVMQLAATGALSPCIDRVLPLEEAREAHERLERREVRGRVVLRP